MDSADAYRAATDAFAACLRTYGDDATWQSLSWCGWSSGWAYGSWSALATIHAWQLVAGVSWLLSAALAALGAWLWWRQRRWRAY